MDDRYQAPVKKTYDRDTLLKLSGSPLAQGRASNMPMELGFTVTRGVVDGALVAITNSQAVKTLESVQKANAR